MAWPRVALLCLLAPSATPAHAQPAPGEANLGPIRCYVDATRISALEHLKAKQLCTGAASELPARCYAQAVDRAGLTDLGAVQLCQGASSTTPAVCAEQLDDTTALSSPAIVAYCAAQRWPMVPSGTGGSPACIQTALARTTLSDHEAARLCAGAASAGPVACYELGDDQTTLSTSDLVDLCTTMVIVPPYSPW